jgi:hypothetical protein
VAHPESGDLQRPARLRRRVQTQIQLALTGGQPLPGDGLQQLEIDIVVRRPDVLDVPRALPRRVHDLNRTCPGAVLTVRI